MLKQKVKFIVISLCVLALLVLPYIIVLVVAGHAGGSD